MTRKPTTTVKTSKIGVRKRDSDRTFYLASLIDIISDALISTDMGFNILEWNAAAEGMYGWRAAEVIGHPLQKFIQSEYMEETTREDALKAVQEEGIWTGEVTQKRKDGTRFPVMASVSLVKDKTGQPIGFVAINRDITEPRQAEEKIESLAKFPNENINPVLRFGRDGRLLFANHASSNLLTMWGCQIGGHPPEDVQRLISESLTTAQSQEMEVAYQDVIASLIFVPVVDKNYVNIYGHDITERKRAERQTIQMKRLYATLSQVNQTIVRVKDREELYQAICDVAVQFGEFAVAWIGLLDEATGDVRPVAANGLDGREWPIPLVNINIGPLVNGLVATAIRTGRVMTSDDLQNDKRVQIVQDLSRNYKFHASAAVPLQLRGKAIGTLNLLSAEADFFQAPEEIHLLEEMGLDISFALDMMENEKEHKQAEEELKRTSQWLLASQRISSTGGWAINLKTGAVWASPEARRIYGTDNRKLTLSFIQTFPLPQYRPILDRALHKLITQGTPYDVEFQITHGINGSIADIHSLAEYDATEHLILGVVQDITDRKRAEEALRENEERLRLSLQAADQGLYDLNVQTGDAVVNREYAQMLGYDPETFVETNAAWIERLHPDDRESVAKAYSDYISGLLPEYRIEFRQRMKDGNWKWILSLGKVIEYDAEGRPLRMLGTHTDITQRKQAEENLNISEIRYRRLFESAKDGILILDAETGIIVDVNPFLVTLLGYSKEALLGKNIWELGFLKDILANKANFLELQQNEYIRYEDLPLETAQGRKLNVEFVSNVYQANYQKVIQCNIRDITERRQAEAQIQRQLKYLSSLRMIDIAISSSFDLHVILDVVLQQVLSQLGVDASALLLFNAHLQTIEYAASRGFRSDALQHTQLMLGEGYAGRAVIERKTIHISDLMKTGGKLASSLFLEHESFVDYYGTPLMVKGEVKGVLEIYHRSHLKADAGWLEFLETLAGQAAIAIDNAQLFENLQHSNLNLERRVNERTAELNQTNAELERANQIKDEFLANMSHELRTPLTSILGLSESLLEERRGSLNDHQHKSLQIIESSGRHLLELINDILDLSKIEAGKFDFYPQPIPVDEICKSSLSFVKSQAVKKSIMVTYTNKATVSKIYADPRRLKQILVNLLNNAVKFTPENGNVTLKVTCDPTEELIQFAVIDTGIGISQRDLKRLFRPFVQVDSSLNRQHEGTGLGLALVQRLTDLHGGSVQVESEAGKGSRFTINLPCLLEEVGKLEKLESKTTPPIGERTENSEVSGEAPVHLGVILLADDNMPSILTIGEYLESHGYEVVVAHDGSEAVEKAEAVHPDLILMDIQMPVMNGLEAIARLRGNARFADTPIIALTALAMPGDRERSLLAGANEYMSKPVSLKTLKQTIEGLLQV